jgi:hypothetical protein
MRVYNWKPYASVFERYCSDWDGKNATAKAKEISSTETLPIGPNELRMHLGAWFAGKDTGVEALAPEASKAEAPKAEPLEIIALEREVRKHKGLFKEVRVKYEALLKVYDKLEDAHNAALSITEPVAIQRIDLSHTEGKRQATAIVQYSDWHVGETVNPATVQGLNKFNPDVARKRAFTCFQNTLRMVQKERQNIEIDTLIIHLGGDFIGGWIHPELMQTNSMSPIQEARYAEELLASGLDFLLNHGKFKQIVAICSRGNHGRNSPKMQYANEAATNYETFIYSGLEKMFGQNIHFINPEADIAYFYCYDWLLRFYHGQQVQYGGGVGGLTIPLNKKQANWDRTKQAHYNFMGHFHQYSHPNSQTTLNGSLKGFDAYAASNGFKFEPPTQSFTLIDSSRFVTTKAPIFCE